MAARIIEDRLSWKPLLRLLSSQKRGCWCGDTPGGYGPTRRWIPVRLWHAILHALAEAGTMTWQITWSLVLGFTLSAVVESLVKKSSIVRLLPDDGPRSLATATGLGAASSSCSYAAVALARSLFRKGAGFGAAMAFQIASTNLVVELGLIMALLLGWQFMLAEFIGAPIMIVLVAVLLRRFLNRRRRDEARAQADLALAGSMEGHAAMDMSVASTAPLWRRITSPDGFTAISHNFVMEVMAIIRDLATGLLIAGAAAAWIPDPFWQHLFFTDNHLAAQIWGPIIGPIVAILTFVCSIGNVPLAAVLWNGGISFGGVSAFIFADLLIVPILFIYRKYYGTRTALTLFWVFYVAMVVAGYVVELLFSATTLVPGGPRHARTGTHGIVWNYTTFLNIIAIALVLVLVWRFLRSGGREMLAMMGGGPDDMTHHDHAHHDHVHHDHAHRAHSMHDHPMQDHPMHDDAAHGQPDVTSGPSER
ncbi:MAG: permease [Actinobacteria bacterium]|nr:permease [Actinomycetota bacterium]